MRKSLEEEDRRRKVTSTPVKDKATLTPGAVKVLTDAIALKKEIEQIKRRKSAEELIGGKTLDEWLIPSNWDDIPTDQIDKICKAAQEERERLTEENRKLVDSMPSSSWQTPSSVVVIGANY